MKKNLFKFALMLVVAALFVASCAPAPVEEEMTQEPFRVAIIMPSSITDMAFSQSMYEGLLIVQQEMGGESAMEIAYSEGMFKVPDAAAAFRDYAAEGYDLVLAHGSQYGTSLAQVAPDFPETSFAWGTALDTFQADGITNVFAYQAEAQEGGYVLGTIAALMSKTGQLGVSGPVEAGDAKLYVDGFEVGAKTANPDIDVNISYTGSFSDVSLMAAAAETHVSAGADMLTGSSQSVVGAIGVAKDKGAYWFGTQWNQTDLAPETVLASQVYDWNSVINDMIASHNAGVMGGKSYTLTFKNGGLVIEYNPAIEVPAEVKAAADAAIQGIIDGTIDPLAMPE
ncbi:MAG: BMP family protein [Anaerolineaceae bacterium]|jgi:basic membrane protein A|nr:BMP family protein [Anaerolineaceae bacterium]